MSTTTEALLVWEPIPGCNPAMHQQAKLADWDHHDGVLFSLSYQPTCYRRGPFRLLIEVCGGEHHRKWGCFDEADQPMRYYHKLESLQAEAEAIAVVLMAERAQHDDPA